MTQGITHFVCSPPPYTGHPKYMSPDSPAFHTEVTVSIGLKKQTQSGNIHSIILDVGRVLKTSFL